MKRGDKNPNMVKRGERPCSRERTRLTDLPLASLPVAFIPLTHGLSHLAI